LLGERSDPNQGSRLKISKWGERIASPLPYPKASGCLCACPLLGGRKTKERRSPKIGSSERFTGDYHRRVGASDAEIDVYLRERSSKIVDRGGQLRLRGSSGLGFKIRRNGGANNQRKKVDQTDTGGNKREMYRRKNKGGE